MSSAPSHPPVDPRGQRFGAYISAAVLIAVLLTGSAWLAAAQAVVFAVAAVNLRFSPYGALYRAVIAPRLAPPAEREAAAPLRFAQGVGFALTAVAAIGLAAGLTVFGLVVTALTLVAVALNAIFGFCIGCEVYLRLPERLQRVLAT